MLSPRFAGLRQNLYQLDQTFLKSEPLRFRRRHSHFRVGRTVRGRLNLSAKARVQNRSELVQKSFGLPLMPTGQRVGIVFGPLADKVLE